MDVIDVKNIDLGQPFPYKRRYYIAVLPKNHGKGPPLKMEPSSLPLNRLLYLLIGFKNRINGYPDMTGRHKEDFKVVSWDEEQKLLTIRLRPARKRKKPEQAPAT